MAIEKFVRETTEPIAIDGATVQFVAGAVLEVPKAGPLLAQVPAGRRIGMVEELLELGALVASTAQTSAHILVMEGKVNELAGRLNTELGGQLKDAEHRNVKNIAKLLDDFRHDLVKSLSVREALLQKSVLRGGHFEDVLANRLPILARGIGRIEHCAGTAGEKARNAGDYLLTLEPASAGSEVKIVVEAKAQKARFGAERIREELRAARLNRGAQAGIFVAESRGSLPDGIGFGQVTDCDFYVLYDSEHGDETLLSCALVMAKAAALASVKVEQGEGFDSAAVAHEISGIRKLLERFSKIELGLSKIDKETSTTRNLADDLKADILAALRRLEGLIDS